MVAGAGNDGPDCSTVMYPPAIYEASYTVGALNTGTDTIAGFSSRGPVTIDGSNRTKPDITAPGTDTRSSYNTSDNAYASLSGTSMATPHSAGAMALLWCTRPELRHDISGSRTTLHNAAHFISSTQCGTSGPPNNVYGWGRVDILAGVNPSPLQCLPCTLRTSTENFDGVTPLHCRRIGLRQMHKVRRRSGSRRTLGCQCRLLIHLQMPRSSTTQS